MISVNKNETCCGCGVCSNACPTQAIKMELDSEGFPYPQVDMQKCFQCNTCEQVCPVLNRKDGTEEILRAFACYALDDTLRIHSTSGGLFPVLAEYFIENLHGKVYGVKFDENFHAMYCSTDKKENIATMQGSKYVQADTGTVYRDIKKHLEHQQNVLFSGLPCQTEALRNFLKREYKNLYIVDIVCFGIASPGIWQDYLETFHDLSKITQVVFKDKIQGWKNWKVKMIENNKETYFDRKDHLYMNSYLQRINVRPSCFQCQFKGIHRNSDFSIADCWGIGEKNKKLNDDRGLSALLIHTYKGKMIFEKIKERLRYEEYEPELLMAGNWAIKNSPEKNEKREEFFQKYQTNNFRDLFLQYFGR